MTATRDSFLKVFRQHGPWIAALLLCQCQLPPRQAWQYIRSNGLLTYWSHEPAAPRPPFGAGGSRSQRYLPARSSYAAGRQGSRPYLSPYTTPYLVPSAPASRYPGRSYAAPSQVGERVGPVRPAPRTQSSAPSETPSVTRIPVEEPSATPPVVRNEPPAPAPGVASKTNSTAPAPVNPAVSDLPYGSSVPGRPNMVTSPYAGKTQLVDVSGMTAGQTVKCPYTGKLFKVPSSQQAANTAEPGLEPKVNSEPKAEDKKP